MLNSLSVGWLWLLAAAATVLLSWALGRWVPIRAFRGALPFVLVACGALAIAGGLRAGYSWPSMLVMYSFALMGMTIGLFPSRKLFTVYAQEINRGVKRERYDVPTWHLVFLGACIVVFAFAGFTLTH